MCVPYLFDTSSHVTALPNEIYMIWVTKEHSCLTV